MKISFKENQREQNTASTNTINIKKSDETIIEEAAELIKKTEQLLGEKKESKWYHHLSPWSSPIIHSDTVWDWIPDWLKKSPEKMPDWIPNILGKGSLLAPDGGISLKDAKCEITPDLMKMMIAQHPEIDLSTQSGLDAACKMGGMTSKQTKEETEEHFETGMGGVKTAAALAMLLPAAAAAAPAAAQTSAIGTTATGTGRALLSPGARALGTRQTARALSIRSIGQVGKEATKKAPSWISKVFRSKWGPFSWRYELGMIAAEMAAPEFYDGVLKYADPWHYAWNTLRWFKIAPYVPLIGDDEPAKFFGSNNGPPEDEKDKELVNQLAAATEDIKIAHEAGNTEEAEKANSARLGIIAQIKEKSSDDYIDVVGAGDDGSEVAVTYGPNNPAVYDFGDAEMQAEYERIIKGKEKEPGDEEFLQLYVYGK